MRITPIKIFFTTFIAIGLLLGFVSQFPDNKLHIVFCDVGQGDAIYIRTPDNQDVLVDGGKSGKALIRCLSDYMPFYDRTIDVVALTHPQADHYGGLIDVLDRYSVKHLVITPADNKTKGFAQLKKLITDKQIPVTNPYTGMTMRIGDVGFHTLWPDRDWLASQNVEYGMLNAESGVLGAYTGLDDLNDVSIYFHVQIGEFDALLTGDGDIRIQDNIMDIVDLPDVEVLKVPHHGSKTGMSEEFLDAVDPELAVISVGKNSYGHPSKSILEILRDRDIQILRTDEVGDVEVVSDGEGWWMIGDRL